MPFVPWQLVHDGIPRFASPFRNRFFGKQSNDYYRELIEWYCSVHKFYNDLLDLFKIKDSSFLHDGVRDPHRTGGKPPLFLSQNKFARDYCELKLTEMKKH